MNDINAEMAEAHELLLVQDGAEGRAAAEQGKDHREGEVPETVFVQDEIIGEPAHTHVM